jgi:hypothetical protein
MIETSAEIGELTKALVKAQGLMKGAEKDSANEGYKRGGKAISYASLASVVEAAKPALQEADLAFSQAPGSILETAAGPVIEITTTLVHGASGQWQRSTLHMLIAKHDAQGVGSAITYGCRYSLMATLGLPPVDDDGEAAKAEVDPATGKPIVTRGPSKAKAREVDGEMRREIDACSTVEELERLWSSKAFQTEYAKHPPDWQGMLVDHFNERIADIKKAVAATAIPHSGDFVPPNFSNLEPVP